MADSNDGTQPADGAAAAAVGAGASPAAGDPRGTPGTVGTPPVQSRVEGGASENIVFEAFLHSYNNAAFGDNSVHMAL